jgi:hypothetical protein
LSRGRRAARHCGTARPLRDGAALRGGARRSKLA